VQKDTLLLCHHSQWGELMKLDKLIIKGLYTYYFLRVPSTIERIQKRKKERNLNTVKKIKIANVENKK